MPTIAPQRLLFFLFCSISAMIVLVLIYQGGKVPVLIDPTPTPRSQAQDEAVQIQLRDQERIANLQIFQLALEKYKGRYGRYPLVVGQKLNLTTEYSKLPKDFLEYHAQPVTDPLTSTKPEWPQPIYWKTSASTYVLFSNLEEMKSVKMKVSPENPKVSIETYSLKLDTSQTAVEYNYWISNLTTNVSITNTPRPSLIPSPTPISTTPANSTNPKKPAQKSSKLKI